MRFISDAVKTWLEEYRYSTKFAAITFERQSTRFLDAVAYFEYCINQSRERIRPKGR